MADATYQPLIYRSQGGATLTAISGATISCESGSTVTLAGTNTLSGATTFTSTLAHTGTSNVTVTDTITSAAPSTRRMVQSSFTLTPSTTMSVGSGGSLAAIRGDITISSSKTFVDGFLYGVQGKVTLNGTLAESSAGRITGVLGQVDLSTGTLTAGQVSAVWGDLQGNPTLTVNDQLYCGRFTNSMSSGKKAQAFQLFYGATDFFLEASADGGSADWCVVAAVGGSQSHKLKVNIFGTTYYIPLNTA